MTVEELTALLLQYPNDTEVKIEAHGHTGLPTDVDWYVAGSRSFVIIHDYPVEKSA